MARTEKTKTAWGLIDKCGQFVIEASLNQARLFSQGRFAFKKSNKWGLLNEKGEIILPHTLSSIGSFCNGLAPFKEGDLWGYLDLNGKTRIKPQFQIARNFSKGLAAVAQGPQGIDKNEIYEFSPVLKWGFINTEGQQVIKCNHRYVHDVIDQYYVGFTQDSAAIYDLEGKIIARLPTKKNFNPEDLFLIGPLSEGLVSFPQRGFASPPYVRFGFLNLEMVFVIKPIFLAANRFANGLAAVTCDGVWRTTLQNTLYGFIDQASEWRIKASYSQAGVFTDGLCAVKNEHGRWGYINLKGEMQIPFQFLNATPFKDSFAVVETERITS